VKKIEGTKIKKIKVLKINIHLTIKKHKALYQNIKTKEY
jgi:hypothetical protein